MEAGIASSRILGIDPGLQVAGYAVLETSDDGPIIRDAGVIRSDKDGSPDMAKVKAVMDKYGLIVA